MRSIENLRDEIKSLKERAALMKWFGIAAGVGAVYFAIDMLSMSVFLLFMLVSMISFGIWNGDASRINRLEEEIEER